MGLNKTRFCLAVPDRGQLQDKVDNTQIKFGLLDIRAIQLGSRGISYFIISC